MELLELLKEKIHPSTYPIALTGSEITLPSGIPSFESIYFGHSLNEILSLEFSQNNYAIFLQTCFLMSKWNKKKPNIFHDALKKLGVPIITENIDMLHLKAGSTNVIQLLGNIDDFICTNCTFTFPFYKATEYFKKNQITYCPDCNSPIKLNIILRGESCLNFNLALNEVYRADTLLVLGSNLERWPINRLVKIAQKQGSRIIIYESDI